MNQFPSDTAAELELVKTLALAAGARRVAQTTAFSRSGEGSLELADAVIDACSDVNPERGFQNLYALDQPYQQKIERIAMQAYGADGIDT